jgi:hypothetical protein
MIKKKKSNGHAGGKHTFGPDRSGEDSAGAKGKDRLRAVKAKPSLGGSNADKHRKKTPR